MFRKIKIERAKAKIEHLSPGRLVFIKRTSSSRSAEQECDDELM